MKTEDFNIVRTSRFIDGVQDHPGGGGYSNGTPPLPPNFQVLPEAHVGRSNTSVAGVSSQTESGTSNQAVVDPVGGGFPVKVHCC